MRFSSTTDFSSTPLFDRLQYLGNRFTAGLGAKIAFAVDADTDSIGVHVAFSDHEHGVDFHLFGTLDFAVDLVAAVVEFCANLMSAQFFQNRARVIR